MLTASIYFYRILGWKDVHTTENPNDKVVVKSRIYDGYMKLRFFKLSLFLKLFFGFEILCVLAVVILKSL